MIKQNKWKLLITSAITLLPILIGIILWDKMPDTIATHWGFDGKADGFSSKWFAVLGIPAFLLAIHWICIFATSTDPKHKNISPKILGLILWICPMISLVMQTGIYAQALGLDPKIEFITPLMVGIMFIVIGNYLPKCKQSYTVGIKLPWTLQDEDNWQKTHRLADFVWVISGILMVCSAFFQWLWIIFVVMILATLIPVIYSYLYYRKHQVK